MRTLLLTRKPRQTVLIVVTKTRKWAVARVLFSKGDSAVTACLHRSGHPVPLGAVKQLARDGLLPYVQCNASYCDVCLMGKFRRSFHGSLTRADRVGTLHVNTKGQVKTSSVQGHRYLVTTVEEFTRFIAVRPIRSKSDAATEVLRFIKWFEKQCGHTVFKVHTSRTPIEEPNFATHWIF